MGCRILFLLLCITIVCCEYHEKMWRNDLEELTFYKGATTKGRKPIPQLKCIHGEACKEFVPESITCHVTDDHCYSRLCWKCEAKDITYEYRLGKIDVNCEGVDYPNDLYIIKGSCGVSLDNFGPDDILRYEMKYSHLITIIVVIIILVVMAISALILWAVLYRRGYCRCRGGGGGYRGYYYWGHGGGGVGGGGGCGGGGGTGGTSGR